MRQYRKIPAITGKKLIKLFKKDRWQIKNKRGDHISMFKDFGSRKRITTIKNTNESILIGTLMAILGRKQTNLGKRGLDRLINKYGL